MVKLVKAATHPEENKLSNHSPPTIKMPPFRYVPLSTKLCRMTITRSDSIGGVLFAKMGRKAEAEPDLVTLKKLNPKLAGELARKNHAL